jgi:hypothetical protein
MCCGWSGDWGWFGRGAGRWSSYEQLGEVGGDADLDTEFRCVESSEGTDIALASEPELSTVVKSGGNGFGDEPTGSAESG